MAVYNPADPYNWRGIAAALADQSAGPNPDGTTRYTLPSMADDLQYIAFLQQDKMARDQAEADTTLRKKKADDDYAQALKALEQQGITSRRDTDTSLLARGAFNSGETVRRRDDLGKALQQGREQADVTLAQNKGNIEADRQRALTQLNIQREQEIAASKARIAAAQNQGRQDDKLPPYAGMGGGGGTGPGPSSTASTSTPRSYSLPPAPAGTLPSSNESGVGYSTAGTGAPRGSVYSPSGGGKPAGLPAFSPGRPKPTPYSKPKQVRY